MKKKVKVFERNSKERGITLVALVITIVILIILAVVAINAVFGDSGLLKYAQDAKNYQANADTSDAEMINDATSYLDSIIGGSGDTGDTDDSFEPAPTPDPETGGTEYSMTNGVIEIKWLSGTSDNVSSTPNAPKVKSISNGTMELVKYDESSQSWVAGSEYNYEKQTGSTENGGTSKWANARVTIDGIESYFVWIPRYAYRIIYFDGEENKNAYINGTITEEQALAEGKILGYSDSRGIVDAEGKKVDGIASTTKTMVSRDYFMTHPAFTSDVTIGGWNDGSDGLEGIWVGKYETSLVDSTGSNIATNSETIGNILLQDVKGMNIAVQPNMSSWRYITIGNMYTNAKGYSSELKSHMLKNSEWGAVAYLTESAYGRNGTEVTINNNSSYITGIAGDTVDADYSSSTTNTYNTEKGVLASSTGNVYGIYDLSGGAWERTASYYNGEDADSTYIGYGSSFASKGGTSDSYSTVYNSIGSGSSSYNQYYIYGDATAETAGWHSDCSDFAYSSYPFFVRSGGYNSGSGAGVFCFNTSGGSYSSIDSFRLALSVL